MKRRVFYAVVFLIFSISVSRGLFSEGGNGFDGTWELIPGKSTDIPLFNDLLLDIKTQNGKLVLVRQWGTNRGYSDKIVLKTDGSLIEVPAPNRNFPTNVFMGVAVKTDVPRHIRAWMEEGRTVLKV